MTRPAEASALRRQFSLPVVLSVALHGLAVAALGTFQLSPPVMPVQNQRTTVDLVTLPPEPVVAPVAEPVVSPMPDPPKPVIKKVSVRKVPHKAEKRVSPRSAAPTLTRVRSVTTPSAPLPVTVASPLFKDLPRVPAPASPPAMAFDGAAIFSVPESMEPPVQVWGRRTSAARFRPLRPAGRNCCGTQRRKRAPCDQKYGPGITPDPSIPVLLVRPDGRGRSSSGSWSCRTVQPGMSRFIKRPAIPSWTRRPSPP